jgi:hypothetical protein
MDRPDYKNGAKRFLAIFLLGALVCTVPNHVQKKFAIDWGVALERRPSVWQCEPINVTCGMVRGVLVQIMHTLGAIQLDRSILPVSRPKDHGGLFDFKRKFLAWSHDGKCVLTRQSFTFTVGISNGWWLVNPWLTAFLFGDKLKSCPIVKNRFGIAISNILQPNTHFASMGLAIFHIASKGIDKFEGAAENDSSSIVLVVHPDRYVDGYYTYENKRNGGPSQYFIGIGSLVPPFRFSRLSGFSLIFFGTAILYFSLRLFITNRVTSIVILEVVTFDLLAIFLVWHGMKLIWH